jgi:hypothetical protein
MRAKQSETIQQFDLAIDDPAQGRQVRDLSPKRMQLVQRRTAQILAIDNLFG